MGPPGLLPDDVVYFLHIPKTAGTSLGAILERMFRPEEICPLPYDRFGDRVRQTPREILARYRLLRAHHDHSIHRFLPRRPRYVTLLRDPVQRVLSLYEDIRRVPSHRLHRVVTEQKLGIREVLEYPGEQDRLTDRQVRQIAGAIEGKDALRGLDEGGLLKVAKAHLDEFAFFGLTERFRDSLTLLGHAFAWDLGGEEARLNSMPASWVRARVADGDLDAIVAHNRLDMELYRYAAARFEERLAEAIGEPAG